MNWALPNRYSRCSMINGESTYHLAVNPNASANTKGSWAVLTSSLPFDIGLIHLCFTSHIAGDMLWDFGIGAEGSEQIILGDLLFSCAQNTTNAYGYRMGHGIDIPIQIPAGTRLALRNQDTNASGAATAIAFVFQKEFSGEELCCGIDTIGAVTADTGGTGLADCGGTAGVDGALPN